MEMLYESLKARGMPTRLLRRNLLMRYCRKKDLEKAEAMKIVKRIAVINLENYNCLLNSLWMKKTLSTLLVCWFSSWTRTHTMITWKEL